MAKITQRFDLASWKSRSIKHIACLDLSLSAYFIRRNNKKGPGIQNHVMNGHKYNRNLFAIFGFIAASEDEYNAPPCAIFTVSPPFLP